MTQTPATNRRIATAWLTSDYTEVDIDKWYGPYPEGCELVVHERGEDPEDGYVLMGFDEVGMFDDDFTHAAYSFVKGL